MSAGEPVATLDAELEKARLRQADLRLGEARRELASVRELPFDTEGRIVLSEELIAHAGLGERAAFVGQGATFQIWEPEAFAAYESQARARAREGRHALSLRRPEGAGGS